MPNLTNPTNLIYEDKIWGATRPVVSSDFYSKHELLIKAGGYCSYHYHDDRANRFTVVKGAVRIVFTHGWRVHATLLTEGNRFDIPSKIPHQFQVVRAGEMIEEYWADRGGTCRERDIVRLSVGGLVDIDVLNKCEGVMITPDSWTLMDLREVRYYEE